MHVQGQVHNLVEDAVYPEPDTQPGVGWFYVDVRGPVLEGLLQQQVDDLCRAGFPECLGGEAVLSEVSLGSLYAA